MGIHAGVLAGVLALGLVSGLDGGSADGASVPAAPLVRVSGDLGRQATIDEFYDVWLRNEQVDVGWTGSVDGCDPGQVGSAGRAATLGQINYFRGLAGLRPVTFDAELTSAAQRTALMMQANNQLSHDPPSWWKCHTVVGDTLAARSNLALGGPGPKAITAYITDSALPSAAHRRWVLNPRTAQMAAGSTGQANALVVVGMPQHRLAVPTWIPWPPAGYFPAPLEPEGHWSLSAGNSKTDFSRAVVRVTDKSGTAYPVKQFPVTAWYAAPTLVWRVSGLSTPTLTTDRVYKVRVTGVERAGERLLPVSWSVTLVKPDRPTTVVQQPVVRGTFAVGQQLAVSPGTWSPTPASWTYQWTRDGTPIPGATYAFYNLSAADEGHVVSAVVRATATYYAPGRTVVLGQVVTG